MRSSTHVHALRHDYCCYTESTIRIKDIRKETNSLYGTNLKYPFSYVARPQSKVPTRPTASKPYTKRLRIRDRAML
jgi:hypothetical protein